MIQTDVMAQLHAAAVQLEKISNMLYEANLYEAGREAKRLSEIVFEEHSQLLIPPAP